jgi:hypothetical protein
LKEVLTTHGHREDQSLADCGDNRRFISRESGSRSPL